MWVRAEDRVIVEVRGVQARADWNEHGKYEIVGFPTGGGTVELVRKLSLAEAELLLNWFWEAVKREQPTFDIPFYLDILRGNGEGAVCNA